MFRSTIVDDRSAPVEVLIPEARHRQQRRYRRSALMWSLVALLVGALIALLITTTSDGSGTSRATSKPPVAVAERGPVLVRPVLCFAYPYAASAVRQIGSLPVCSPAHELTAAALGVTPNTPPQGYASNNVSPDPALAGYPSTTHDSPGQVVLLGGLVTPAVNGGVRYLLGPSAMSLSVGNVESAVVRQTHSGQWIVNIHLSHAGGTAWDRVAQQSFHQLLAIDMGGKVVSAPIIEPTKASYSSFDRSMQISGALTAANARAVAAAVRG